jgi:hypothetical protein
MLLSNTAFETVYGPTAPRPPSVLIFKVTNPATDLTIYLAVCSFIADPGTAILPKLAFESLALPPNGGPILVQLQLAHLLTGKALMIRPDSPRSPADAKSCPDARFTDSSEVCGPRFPVVCPEDASAEAIFLAPSDLTLEVAPPESDFTHD